MHLNASISWFEIWIVIYVSRWLNILSLYRLFFFLNFYLVLSNQTTDFNQFWWADVFWALLLTSSKTQVVIWNTRVTRSQKVTFSALFKLKMRLDTKTLDLVTRTIDPCLLHIGCSGIRVKGHTNGIRGLIEVYRAKIFKNNVWFHRTCFISSSSIIISVVCTCLSVCLSAYFFEVLRPTAAKLGEGVRLGQEKTKFECFGDAMTGRVIRGQMGSNPYR